MELCADQEHAGSREVAAAVAVDQACARPSGTYRRSRCLCVTALWSSISRIVSLAESCGATPAAKVALKPGSRGRSTISDASPRRHRTRRSGH